mgnify:CR=1 FL=1|jgi:hypothetical protein
MKKYLLVCFLLISSFAFSSDLTNKDTIPDKLITKINGGYLFQYYTPATGIRDDERYFPMFFKMVFPKSYKSFSIFAEQHFFFNFKSKQYIVIYYDYRDYFDIVSQNIDTMYLVNKSVIDIIFESFANHEMREYVRKEIRLRDDRYNKIVRRKGVTFLLCNIKEEELNTFEKSIDSFNIIRPYRIDKRL